MFFSSFFLLFLNTLSTKALVFSGMTVLYTTLNTDLIVTYSTSHMPMSVLPSIVSKTIITSLFRPM